MRIRPAITTAPFFMVQTTFLRLGATKPTILALIVPTFSDSQGFHQFLIDLAQLCSILYGEFPDSGRYPTIIMSSIIPYSPIFVPTIPAATMFLVHNSSFGISTSSPNFEAT